MGSERTFIAFIEEDVNRQSVTFEQRKHSEDGFVVDQVGRGGSRVIQIKVRNGGGVLLVFCLITQLDAKLLIVV